MAKWRERIAKILDTEKERVEAKLKEAEGNYRDTGHSRYYTQIEKLEADLKDIETFRNSTLAVERAEGTTSRYRDAIREYRDYMQDYIQRYKGTEQPIEKTVRAMESRLNMSLSKRGIL